WRIIRPITYPARSEGITALLNGLTALEWQARISESELKDQPDAQEKFGFTKPQFSVVLQGGGPARHLLIGQTSPLGDQVFLYVVGNYDIYLVSTNLLPLIPQDKNQWRDLSFLHLESLPYDSLQVRFAGKGFDLERDPTNQLWFMTKPLTARADTSRINQLLQQLQDLRVKQFITDEPQADLDSFGLSSSAQTPGLDLSFWRGTNRTADLRVGSSPTNQPGLAYARLLNPSNVVAIASTPLRPWQSAYTNFLDHHLLSRSLESIRAISVQGDGAFTVEKQTNGHWQVRGTVPFPTDEVLMRDWLASFTNIEAQIEKTVATDFADYGLAHPLLQYTVIAAQNEVMAQIEFGTNSAGKIFERRTDESFVNAIPAGDFDRLPSAAWQLRDRHIWSFDSSNVVSLTIHQLGGTRKYLRDPEGDWTFAPGYHGPPFVNWPALEEGVHRLGELKAIYWSGLGETNLKQFGFSQVDFSLSLEIKKGSQFVTNSIEFGSRSPYLHPYASVVKEGQRLIFEFPADLYENFVEPDMTIPAALRYHP
ncbi:MAG TPA: DUF4340 domain-containing protein, partial [Candidatus Saccharimonadales bacterium]|nr:DUF4340 domain-containing protein [Candidatus Saccharimonadales bacterium]